MSIYQNAKLIVTPNGAKSGKLYSLKPVDGSYDLDVVRATTATRINASGLIETVAVNVPRIDYTNVSCPSILIEPQSTNLSLRSEEFENATWLKFSAGTGSLPSVIANNTVSLTGGLSADTVTFNRGAGNALADQSFIQQNLTFPSTASYVFSVWLKAETLSDIGKQVFLRLGGGGGLIPKTLTSNWVRHFVTGSIAGGANLLQIGNRGAVTNSNSVGVCLWGAQLELGTSPTSYIPTVAIAVARNADVISKIGLSGIITITETFENGTTNVISGSPTSYTMSTGRIKHVIGI